MAVFRVGMTLKCLSAKASGLMPLRFSLTFYIMSGFLKSSGFVRVIDGAL
jgi:hypothetical protein